MTIKKIFEKGKDPLYHRNFQINFLKEHGLKPHHVFLDYGCGECVKEGALPRLNMLLINYLDKGCYWGVDIRKCVIDNCVRAVDSFGLSQKKPHLIHITNMKTIDLKQVFDYIWAFSVIIHMTDEIVDDFLRFTSKHLKGVLYMNVNIAPRRTRTSWKGFPVVDRPLKFYKDLATKHSLEMVDVGSLGSWGYKADADSNKQRILRMEKK